jgi:peptidoglycan/xylan/chitin deacetylase (PgdA/CDA1 family)
MAHGLLFHHFHGKGHPPSQGSLSAEGFAAMLDAVGLDRFLPAQAWRERALAGRLRPGDLCLTFDDNLRCQADIAVPVLERLGLTAFFFVNSAPLAGQPDRLELYRHFRSTRFAGVEAFYAAFEAAVGAERVEAALDGVDIDTYLAAKPFYSRADRRFRYLRDRVLSEDDYTAAMDRMIAADGLDITAVATGLWMDADTLRRLDRGGHVVGLHSHGHPTCLSALPGERQAAEWRTNRELLAGILGHAPDTAAFPCGDYDTVSLDILGGLGVRLAFRADMAAGSGSLLELPRENHSVTLARLGKGLHG